MNTIDTAVVVRFVYTALIVMLIIPVCVLMSWIGITYHYWWGYPAGVGTLLLTVGSLALLRRIWRGYGRRFWAALFPENELRQPTEPTAETPIVTAREVANAASPRSTEPPDHDRDLDG